MPELTGIVLTGGRSSRMGQDKASLVLGGSTLLERVVASLSAVADEIVVVRAPEQPLPLVTSSSGTLVVVSDLVEGAGPLAGLARGLEAGSAPFALVVGVDHPFLRPSLLTLLADHVRGGAPWALPEFEGHAQPLCSAISRELLVSIRARLEAGERSPVGVADALGAVRIGEAEWRSADPDGLSFLDVDTPEEFAAAERRLQR